MDLWCRELGPDGVYADITWMAHSGRPDDAFSEVFAIVLAARDRGIAFIQDAVEQGRRLQGWRVDRAVRELIEEAGYGHGVLHRTGHSLGSDALHGEAVHLDDFETRDERALIPGVAVTVEPGVYLPRFGVRSEVNVFLASGAAEVTTVLQKHLDVFEA
jgi:Xaa-Pro aminopeptidase